MPKTAIGLGTTTDALSKMTFSEQLEYVDKYLAGNLKKYLDENGKIKPSFTQPDLFMTIFYPVSIGRPDFVFPKNVQKANGGIKTPKDYTRAVLTPKKNPPFPDIPFDLNEAKTKSASLSGNTTKNKLGKTIFFVALLTVAGYVLLTQTKQGKNILSKLK